MQSFWDERYGQSEYAYGVEPNAFFAEELTPMAPGRLLLAAEGEGRNAVWAAEQGWSVDAFDFSPVARDKCSRLAADRGVSVRYQVASFDDARIEPGAFDVVGLLFAHVHESRRRDIHRTMAAALRPGGRLLLEAFTKDQLARTTGGPRSAEMLYDPAEIREDFAALDIVRCEAIRTELHEGRYHDGVAAVVRLVAVR